MPGEGRKPSLQETMIAVSARAGLPLWLPEDIGGHCCATIWHSKGYREGNSIMANRIAESLWRWSDGSRLPIVCDASSCSFGITSEIVEHLTPENREHHVRLKIFDSVAWAHDRLLPKLKIEHKAASAVVHPSCSINHLNLAKKLHAIASALGSSCTQVRRPSGQQSHLRAWHEPRHRQGLRIVYLFARGIDASQRSDRTLRVARSCIRRRLASARDLVRPV